MNVAEALLHGLKAYGAEEIFVGWDGTRARLSRRAEERGLPAEIFVRAHGAHMKNRETILESTVKPPPTGAVPRPVPGSGGATPPVGTPVQPRTLREATKAAAAAAEQGQLIMAES